MSCNKMALDHQSDELKDQNKVEKVLTSKKNLFKKYQ